MSINIYQKEIRDHLFYFATFPLSTKVKVGDIGVMEQGKFLGKFGRGLNFVPLGDTLQTLGIDFEVSEGESRPDEFLTHFTESSVVFKQGGKAVSPELLEANLNVNVHFEKANSIFFKVQGSKQYQLLRQAAIGLEIEKMYREKKWKKEWVVVSQVVEVDRAIVIISKEPKVKVTLNADGKIQVGGEEEDGENISGISLAEVGLNTNLDHAPKRFTLSESEKDLTPLFKITGIKFGGKYGNKSKENEQDDQAEPVFGEIDYYDIEEAN